MKKVTIKEIAKRAETSVSTVSNVMNGKAKCSKETKERVLEVIKESGYRPNQAARTLVNKKSNLVGVIIFNQGEALVENKNYQKIINSIISELSKKDCDLIIGDGERNIDMIEWIGKRDLEGLIIIGQIDLEGMKKLDELQLPIVFIDNYEVEELTLDHRSKVNYSYITSDDTIAGYEATEFLLNNECKRIAFVGDEKESIHERRYLGYKAAIFANSLEEDIKINCEIDYDAGGKIVEEVLLKDEEKIYKNIQGICVSSDIIAFGIINKLKEKNIKVPEDIKIIGFDNSDCCEYMSPKLTSVDLNFTEKGEKAVELIFNQLECENDSSQNILLKNFSIDLKIIERESI